MGAKSIKQLEQQIMRRLCAAMDRAKKKSEEIMIEEVGGFYAGGTPVIYKRTGQLMNTPETEGVFVSGTSASFTAKLNQEGGYSTGTNPSMGAVLELTNSGSYPGMRPPVGAVGHWDRAKARIEEMAAAEIQAALK